MASRPTWKGTLKISLVAVPVRIFPATSTENTIRFNQLHNTCETRVTQKKWCNACQVEVDKTEILKGYEHQKSHYVVLKDDELAAARPESTRVINLERFAHGEVIDPIYVDRPYYVAPDDPRVKPTFNVIQTALKGRTGIGKITLSGREHRVAVQSRGNGILMLLLRQESEVRNIDQITELEGGNEAPNPAEVQLAQQVIGTLEGEMDFGGFEDAYQVRVRQIINAKIAGEEITEATPAPQADVVDLMAALKKSLAQNQAEKTQDNRPWPRPKPADPPPDAERSNVERTTNGKTHRDRR